MSETLKNALVHACRTMLRPIALLLLKGGMTWKEFSELSKSVFVSVATDEFGIRGRPTNVSRVSILTGISRKEVKRQRDLLEAELPPPSTKTTDATRLLSGWHQDPVYQGADGQPIAITAAGPAPSFHTLFQAYGGDTPEQTLIRELKNAGSIAENDDGEYVALRRYHMPARMDEGNVRFFGTNLHDHANTLTNNLTEDISRRRLEGFAVDDRVHPDAVDEFRQYLDERGQQFLEEIDAWLSEHRVDANDFTTTPVRLGLGVYAVEGSLPEGTLS
ncbi:MAG: DUF6502 family protein [Woeseiaceae bacterium]|nr:DUF6502 family protein [Woeseiaceae bacterium]